MAQYKKFNVVRAKKYTGNDGSEQTAWRNVGMLTLFQKPDGTESGLLEVNHLDGEFQVFPFQPRDNQGGGNQYNQSQQPANQQYNQDTSSAGNGIEYPESDINPDDIPF